MALYPDLNAVVDSAKKKAGFKNASHLAFSQASQSTTDFETINDKVLREMNERAKKQLENKVQTSVNPFKLGDSAKPRSPQKAATPITRKRFSTLHKSQFHRMESIESHPKVLAKNSRMNLRQQYQEGASPAKRGQVKAEESPTKRLRRAPAVEPTKARAPAVEPTKTRAPAVEPTKTRAPAVEPTKTLRPSSSRVSLRSQSSRPNLRTRETSREPTRSTKEPSKQTSKETTREPSKVSSREPTKEPTKQPRALNQPPPPKSVPEYMKLSKTSEKIRARASQANLRSSLRGPTLERPDMKELPRETRSRTLRASASCRDVRGSRPSTANVSDEDAMDLDSSLVSQDSPSAEPPIARRKQLDLPSVPKHIPSYARPTVSTIRRSQSQQLHKDGVQHAPSRVASMFGALSRVPRKNPDLKR